MGILGNALSIRAVYWRYFTIYFPNEIDMLYVADCFAQQHIFHVFDWERYRYAASLMSETITIPKRDVYHFWSCRVDMI